MTGECPHPSVGLRCKQCEIERALTNSDTEWYDCPRAGCENETSGPGVICYRCRGGVGE